jgi:predicted RNA-binding protein with PIN domain
LTGAPITDMKITLLVGRAHEKHTEGGDFRQATYRAVRQGLMQAESLLLEPWYDFVLSLPAATVGRAITDIKNMGGDFEPPETLDDTATLSGRVPAAGLGDYAQQVASYTQGQGQLQLSLAGYFPCHNTDEVLAEFRYDPTADMDNTPDSVFCSHGAGFVVPWDRVPEYMHLEGLKLDTEEDSAIPEPQVIRRNLNIDEKELEAIMEREFGPIKRRVYSDPKQPKTVNVDSAKFKKSLYIIDGYNVIFAWDELTSLAAHDLESARIKLVDIMVNYSAFTNTDTGVVFDAYRVENGGGEKYTKNKVRVVFTKENETGDAYIEKLIATIGKNDSVSVVTSDGLIQLSAVRAGVLRISAREFENDVDRVYMQINDTIEKINKIKPITIKEKMQ